MENTSIMTDDQIYEMLSELAGIDTHDTNLRDHPKAYEIVNKAIAASLARAPANWREAIKSVRDGLAAGSRSMSNSDFEIDYGGALLDAVSERIEALEHQSPAPVAPAEQAGASTGQPSIHQAESVGKFTDAVDDERVLIRRDVLAAAVYAIVNHKDAPATVEAMRAVYLQKGQP